MLDSQEQMIYLPIQNSLHQELSLTKHIISYYIARKVVVDIAIDAGYLTRRLIEVVHVILCRTDCSNVQIILHGLKS